MQTYNFDFDEDTEDYPATLKFPGPVADDSLPVANDSLPVAGDSLPVELVRRRVCQPQDMYDWERSEARAEVLVFVRHMNDVSKRYPAVASLRRRRQPPNYNLDRAVAVLRTVRRWAVKRSMPGNNNPETAAERFFHFQNHLRADGRSYLTGRTAVVAVPTTGTFCFPST